MKNLSSYLSGILLLSLLIVSASTEAGSKKSRQNNNRWALTNFRRPLATPVISPDSTQTFDCPMHGKRVRWENGDTFNPAAVTYGDKVVMLYRAEDRSGMGIGKRTSRIGYAVSADGIHFERESAPVLFPDATDSQAANEVPGGCEDPRVAVTEDGRYVMMYTQWNRKVARLAVATSTDLHHWTKHGPAFAKAYNGRFKDMFSKSASIFTKLKGGRLVITKMKGHYWMYWGEQAVNLAWSDDLVNWTPLLDTKGNLLKVMQPRDGYFDSMLTECGPPAIVTKKGILLLYNGKNRAGARGDKDYAANAYCAGQALFSLSDPTKLIGRLDKPFFSPTMSFEKSGQYPSGTVFIEGLVHHQGRWLLYYGCADSRVGVAVREE